MVSGKPGLADFQRPPAVETVLGLHFLPLQNWKTPYFGLFWQEIKREFPDAQVHPPLAAEQGLRLELNPAQATIKLTGEVRVRWWYFHKSGKRLIQVQTDSFIQNWRKRDNRDPYLHYAKLRPAFKDVWLQFLRFLRRHKVEPPRIHHCEVTYVNHIDRGEGWRTLGDLAEVVSVWTGRTYCGFLPPPEIVSINSFYPIGNKAGRLQVMLRPGIRESDAKQTLQLTLTALCAPASSQTPDLLKAFDLGRKWIVKGFEDVTTEKMHQIWKKKRRRRPE
jgi:uncharacterized protein (TIGR04255 family)